jgi:hypothetical protein
MSSSDSQSIVRLVYHTIPYQSNPAGGLRATFLAQKQGGPGRVSTGARYLEVLVVYAKMSCELITLTGWRTGGLFSGYT